MFSPLPTTAIVSLFALAAATLFYLSTRPAPLRPPADLKCQTVGIEVRRPRPERSPMSATNVLPQLSSL